MRLLNFFIPGSVRIWFTQLLLGQQRQEQQAAELKTQMDNLYLEVSEMRKKVEELIAKITQTALLLAAMFCLLSFSVAVAAARVTDYFQTLTSDDTLTVTGNGCKVEVVSNDGNEIIIKCFEPKAGVKTALAPDNHDNEQPLSLILGGCSIFANAKSQKDNTATDRQNALRH